MIEKFTNSTEFMFNDPFPERFHLGFSVRHYSEGEEKIDLRMNECI
jgi:hypothetical protein